MPVLQTCVQGMITRGGKTGKSKYSPQFAAANVSLTWMGVCSLVYVGFLTQVLCFLYRKILAGFRQLLDAFQQVGIYRRQDCSIAVLHTFISYLGSERFCCALRFHVTVSYLLTTFITGGFSPFLTGCSYTPGEENGLGLHFCQQVRGLSQEKPTDKKQQLSLQNTLISCFDTTNMVKLCFLPLLLLC